jgi:hypothetical protein
MAEKLVEELDQLTDEEIEARLAAAVWVDEKRAAGELEIARSAKEAAWAAVAVAKEASSRANLAITIASVATAAAISAAVVALVTLYLKQ